MTGADRRVVISGCSGGGKSTLLAELARRGFAAVPEPGRRVVAGGGPMPWADPAGFARAAAALAEADLREAAPGTVFFDRGLVDAAAALAHATGGPLPTGLRGRYHRVVFLTPPWPAIYVTDAERRHGFEEAAAEYARLEAAYAALGYEAALLPRLPVAARADWLAERVSTHR